MILCKRCSNWFSQGISITKRFHGAVLLVSITLTQCYKKLSIHLTNNLVFLSSPVNPIKSAMSCSSSSFALSFINSDQIFPQEGILSFLWFFNSSLIVEKSLLMSPRSVTNNDVAQPSLSSHALKERATLEENYLKQQTKTYFKNFVLFPIK